jgi:hypothetical protein
LNLRKLIAFGNVTFRVGTICAPPSNPVNPDIVLH